MKNYIKKFEEVDWSKLNPFVSKEEKEKRIKAEQEKIAAEKRKAQEEKYRIAKEQKEKIAQAKKEKEELDKKKIKEKVSLINNFILDKNNFSDIEFKKIPSDSIDPTTRNNVLYYKINTKQIKKTLSTFKFGNEIKSTDNIFKILIENNKLHITFNLSLEIDDDNIQLPDEQISINTTNNLFRSTKRYHEFGVSYYHNKYDKTVEFTLNKSKSFDFYDEYDDEYIDDELEVERIIGSFLFEIFEKSNNESLKYGIVKLNLGIEKIDQHNKKIEKINAFREAGESIKECFYDVIDVCNSHKITYDDKSNQYIFQFNINTIKVNSYNLSVYVSPSRTSRSREETVTANKANFNVDDNLLHFFSCLSEAKSRINEMVPDCQFNVEMINGTIILKIF